MKGFACSQETRERALAMRLEGRKLEDIAFELDIDPSTVAKFCRQAGLPGAQLRHRHDTEWPTDRSERLRALWADGKTVAVIAGLLGVTGSSVVGRVRRMGLPSRPSPIIRGKPEDGQHAPHRGLTAEERKARQVERQKGYDKKRASVRMAARKAERAEKRVTAVAKPAPVQPAAPQHVPVASAPPPVDLLDFPPEQPERGRPRVCTFTDGERGSRRWCHHPVTPGSSWCAVHGAILIYRRAA